MGLILEGALGSPPARGGVAAASDAGVVGAPERTPTTPCINVLTTFQLFKRSKASFESGEASSVLNSDWTSEVAYRNGFGGQLLVSVHCRINRHSHLK